MFLLRRTALRAVTSASKSFSTRPRTFVTQSPSLLRFTQGPTPFGLQRRYASDEVDPSEPRADESAATHHNGEHASTNFTDSPSPSSADADDHSSITEAISSATSTVSSATSEAAEAVTGGAAAAAAAVGLGDATAPRVSRTGVNRTDQARKDPQVTSGVYLGNLFFSVSEEEIKTAFQKFGDVKEVRIVYDRRGLSRGIAFVNYKTTEEATRAIEEMNGQPFEGRTLVAHYAVPRVNERSRRPSDIDRSKAQNPESRVLFVGNMSFDISDKDLNDLFLEVDNCTDVRIAMDRRTGLPRGFAHATFTNVESAKKAREYLNGKEVYGRNLRIDYSTPPTRRNNEQARIDPSADYDAAAQ